ncbi:hypothetical protein JIN85_19970 [Luteolibacter pohnpeiensis]|uniref:HNH endonuclease 5 domain-containing protein n=2 Tax=Luteolibacter pohnpeiensis TaxID=454153 RepID=A0A934SB76_9BACT|nr:hypothetical protein [Luteolibacter pohnpeiensis]
MEHIIPKALGNDVHVLGAGWVCDQCNNYLARKVEEPFLSTQYGKLSRFEMGVPNRRGRTPIVSGFHLGSRTKLDFQYTEQGLAFSATSEEDERRLIGALKTQCNGTFILPASEVPKVSYELARFIGMIALEALAYRCMDVEGWNQELVDNESFDELRNYVRRGRPGFVWPIHIRQIYPANFEFSDATSPSFQVLHEFDFLCLQSQETPGQIDEMFAVIAIFGIEYTINLGGPEIEGFLEWLDTNGHASYLYSKNDKQNKAEQATPNGAPVL